MKLQTLVLLVGMAVSAFSLSAQNAMASEQTGRVEKQVIHELNMLPYVNAFDYLSFQVDAYHTVTLTGDVTDPVVKSDAENAVKRIEGVEHVSNQIQVLHLSPIDDGLRVRLFRKIYGFPEFQKYALGNYKPIRIIVNGGRVTLMGVVDSQADKNLASLRAKSVPGSFSVDNQLRVVKA